MITKEFSYNNSNFGCLTKVLTKDKASGLGISVIIPAHNAEKTIKRCLDAIQSSSLSPLEVIVVDDASTDKTREIANQDIVKLVCLGTNVGQGRAKNIASEVTKGDILVFVDADIVVAKDTFELITETFRQNPDAGAITGCLDGNAPVTGFFSRYKNRYMEFVFSRLPNKVDFLFTSIAAIRRNTFLPFAESRLKADDTELGFRLSESGAKILFCPRLKVQHIKEYSLHSFLRNEFRIPYDWIQIFLSRHGFDNLVKKGRFAHASFSQIMGLVLASGSAILLITYLFNYTNILLPFLGLVATMILNFSFIKHLSKNEGIKFALVGTIVSIIDPIVMSFGILAGFAKYLLNSIKLPQFNFPGNVKKQQKVFHKRN